MEEPQLRGDLIANVDVLHHTTEPMILLREAARVARQVIVIKDHLLQGVFAYSTLRFMDWVGNAPHNIALHTIIGRQHSGDGAFDKLRLSVNSWESNLKLYAFPADLIFGRSLHFVATLRVPGPTGKFKRRARVIGLTKGRQCQIRRMGRSPAIFST